jgi:nucleotide-binding universal stress UspA family protein
MMPPKLILAPIDFSDSSRKALDVATDMASRLAASLLLVHIVPAVPDLPEGISIFKEGEYDSELHKTASKQLSELAATLENKNLNVRTEVGTANDVGMELVRIAEHDNVDMIVIATHGMTGWRRIAYGSVAQKVVEQAACPVLILREKATHHAADSKGHPAPSRAAAGG